LDEFSSIPLSLSFRHLPSCGSHLIWFPFMLTLMISCKDRHFLLIFQTFFYFLSYFLIIYYLCRWFGEKSGLTMHHYYFAHSQEKRRKL
jgi:hypothetical protein